MLLNNRFCRRFEKKTQYPNEESKSLEISLTTDSTYRVATQSTFSRLHVRNKFLDVLKLQAGNRILVLCRWLKKFTVFKKVIQINWIWLIITFRVTTRPSSSRITENNQFWDALKQTDRKCELCLLQASWKNQFSNKEWKLKFAH